MKRRKRRAAPQRTFSFNLDRLERSLRFKSHVHVWQGGLRHAGFVRGLAFTSEPGQVTASIELIWIPKRRRP